MNWFGRSIIRTITGIIIRDMYWKFRGSYNVIKKRIKNTKKKEE